MSNELQHALSVLAIALAAWLPTLKVRRRVERLERAEGQERHRETRYPA